VCQGVFKKRYFWKTSSFLKSTGDVAVSAGPFNMFKDGALSLSLEIVALGSEVGCQAENEPFSLWKQPVVRPPDDLGTRPPLVWDNNPFASCILRYVAGFFLGSGVFSRLLFPSGQRYWASPFRPKCSADMACTT
jgi:hypothetical protein